MERNPDAKILKPKPSASEDHAQERSGISASDRREGLAVLLQRYGPVGFALLFVAIQLGTMVFWVAPLGIAFLLSNVWVASGVYVYGAVLLLIALPTGFIVYTGFIRYHARKLGESGYYFGPVAVRLRGLITLFQSIVSTAVFIVAAGQFFRYWAIDFGGFIASKVTSYWDWTAYAAFWVLDNLLANVGQIFGWEQTTIHPTALPARIAVYVYNILLAVVVIAGIVQAVRWVRSGRMQ